MKNLKTKEQLDASIHKEVWIEHDDMGAWVDELLAPMILLMWKLGIKTEESCQGTPTPKYPDDTGWSRIYFRDMEDPRKFLSLAFQPTIEEKKAIEEYGSLCLPFAEWKMTCLPMWSNNRIEFSIGVCFSPTMIPVLTERLRIALVLFSFGRI